MTDKPAIVVLGAGFGGLRAAILLAKKIRRSKIAAEIILIDRNNYHTYTPSLYEIATTSKETANYLRLKEIAAFPVADLIKKLPIRFIQDEVLALNFNEGKILCAGGAELKFDYLLLAPGSETNYFNIPGLKENALSLKTFIDAVKIRDAIWELAPLDRCLEIIIGGGGSTGVELAGEIQGWMADLRAAYKNCRAAVKIVEAAPAILPGFSAKVIRQVQRRLKKLNIETINNEIIADTEKEAINLKSGKKLAYDLLIWAGGVKAPDLIAKSPFKTEPRGRAAVIGEMVCIPQTPDLKLASKIYAIGDAVCFYDSKSDKPIIAGAARAALIQAKIAAYNIICDLTGKKEYKKYRLAEYPYIIPVGGKYAVAKIGPLVISGFLGWLIKGLVELNYLLSIMPVWQALKIWLKGLRIFIQNDRLG
jgi:NADH dehydrogenase